jgi:hypothetical protein
LKQGGGKEKGGAYEREICEILSNWVSRGSNSDLFWRSAGSGSRATNRKSKGMQSNQTGDITASDPLGTSITGHLFIECKHYKSLQLQSLIYGTPKNGSILQFWHKVCEDAFFFAKRPVIIARQNNKKDLIGIDYILKHRVDSAPQAWSLVPLATFPSLELHLYFLEDFLQNVNPDIFKRVEPNG